MSVAKCTAVRRTASLPLGVAVTLACGLMLLVGLSTSQASPPGAPALRPDPGAAGELQATSVVTLVVATSPDYWPMEYYSGTQIVGFDIDLMDAIGARMGIPIVYLPVPFPGILAGLVAGNYDAVISSLTIVPEREEIVDFCLPYVILGEDERIAIAVQEGDHALRWHLNEALRSLRDDGTLEGMIAALAVEVPDWQPRLPDWITVATSPDYWPMEYYSGTQIVGHDIDLMNYIGAEMGATVAYTYVQFSDLLPGLVAGTYDAVISTLTVVPEREEIVDFTLPYVTLGQDEEIAIAVQEGDDALRFQLNGALSTLRDDGTLEALVAAIAADVPDWQPRLPGWPRAFLPWILRGPGQ